MGTKASCRKGASTGPTPSHTPGKTCFRHLAASPSARAGGYSQFLFPFVIIINTWATVKAFMQAAPGPPASSHFSCCVPSQSRCFGSEKVLREQLFPATSPAAPPHGVKSSQLR